MSKKRADEPNGAIQKLYQARQLALRGVLPNDDEFRGAYPALWDLLTSTWIDERHRVEPSRIEVQAVGGDWWFKCVQPTLRAHKAVAVRGFTDGLPALERAVADAAQPWNFWLNRKLKLRESEKPETE